MLVLFGAFLLDACLQGAVATPPSRPPPQLKGPEHGPPQMWDHRLCCSCMSAALGPSVRAVTHGLSPSVRALPWRRGLVTLVSFTTRKHGH